ncbi:LysE family transporter [Pseudomonas sp. NPDC007930]|uniref:LysE family translocator n=1 Tax=Pseudomonas sp. NPDC007930 TaxID=3364417 RepID=UPI0036E1BAA6
MSLALSMAAFALATSITPGPVNLVALSGAARHGLAPALRHVSGATVGFTLLLLLSGLGLHTLLRDYPLLGQGLQGVGVAYLVWLALSLALDNGQLHAGSGPKPAFISGALMQWLNPKAWLACGAGMAAFAGDGGWARVGLFAAIYFVVCYASLACWALAGRWLRQRLGNPARVRLFNRSMAALLAGSALYLLR